MANEFQIEVLADGKIKVTAPGGFDADRHMDADEFLKFIEGMAGGKVERKSLQPHQHQHHGHQHRHGPGGHHHH